jgi:hypothetical protein
MWDALSREEGMPFEIFMLLLWGMIFLCILVSYAIKTWRKHEAAKMEHELKLEMLSRGMSADEIERVLAAKSVATRELSETLSCGGKHRTSATAARDS